MKIRAKLNAIVGPATPFSEFPSLRKELWGGEFWSDGYYAATVGERGNWALVERYVRAQGKKPQDEQLRLF